MLTVLLVSCGDAAPVDMSAMSECRSITVVDRTGAPVTGIEDLAIDHGRALAYLSAYDRRAIADELKTERGPLTTGGIYVLDLSAPFGTTAVAEPLIGSDGNARAAARPHGISLNAGKNGARLAAIDRRYERRSGTWRLAPHLVRLRLTEDGRRIQAAESRPFPATLCSPNDLAFVNGDLLVTNDHGACSGLARIVEDVLGLAGAILARLTANGFDVVVSDVPFANGVAVWADAAVPLRLSLAATRANGLYFFPGDTRNRKAARATHFLDLGAAPDNITVGPDGALYVAAHPSLFTYALFRSALFGVKRAPSEAYRVTTDKQNRPQAFRIFADPAGQVISGATAVARYRDILLVAAAYDDRLAMCDLGNQRSLGLEGREHPQ